MGLNCDSGRRPEEPTRMHPAAVRRAALSPGPIAGSGAAECANRAPASYAGRCGTECQPGSSRHVGRPPFALSPVLIREPIAAQCANRPRSDLARRANPDVPAGAAEAGPTGG